MALIGEEVQVYRIVDNGREVGYLALRRTSYQWRKRRGLSVKKWVSREIEGNAYFADEGRPTGFEPIREAIEDVETGIFRYRGRPYHLERLESDEERRIWDLHLSDE